MFKNNKSHGQGTVTWSAPHKSAGEKQVGEFRDGKLHGQRTLTFRAPHKSAGQMQIGEFRAGKLHGQGTYIKSDGRVFEGIFKDGKLNMPRQ